MRGATLADLDLPRFRYLYLPRAFDAEVPARNDRTVEERLAATKMIMSVADPTPKVLGVLMLGPRPMDAVPGAYVQFLRFAGTDRGAPIIDSARFDGPVAEAVRDLDATLRSHIRASVDIGSAPTEIRRTTYPLPALQELVRNALMHRTCEATHAPVQIAWFTDRIEIASPGGPYGDVSATTFGQPGLIDYRNPNLAEAMRVSGLVQRYGVGIPIERRELHANNQPAPDFDVDAHRVRCTVYVRPDWPEHAAPGQSGDRAMHSIGTPTTARDLEAAGIEHQHTEAIATTIGYSDEQAASKADLAALRADAKADLAALESRIDAKLAALRSEMRWMFGFQGALILAMAAKLFGIVQLLRSPPAVSRRCRAERPAGGFTGRTCADRPGTGHIAPCGRTGKGFMPRMPARNGAGPRTHAGSRASRHHAGRRLAIGIDGVSLHRPRVRPPWRRRRVLRARG